jgi:hypothetical protein
MFAHLQTLLQLFQTGRPDLFSREHSSGFCCAIRGHVHSLDSDADSATGALSRGGHTVEPLYTLPKLATAVTCSEDPEETLEDSLAVIADEQGLYCPLFHLLLVHSALLFRLDQRLKKQDLFGPEDNHLPYLSQIKQRINEIVAATEKVDLKAAERMRQVQKRLLDWSAA